jgi:hypothetical protein
VNPGIRLLAIGVAAAALTPAVSSIPPTGCTAPDVLASNLKALTDRDWNGINEKKLQSTWPAEIGGIECNAGACQTTGRQDRVINNECQCCELFGFNIERNDKGEVTAEHLHNVVIYYSKSTRNGLLGDAKVLARAMGLPDSDVATIGFKQPQDFNWVADKGKPQEITLLNVRLYQQDGVWTAYCLWSRQPL